MRQLLGAGMSRGVIGHRARVGWLERLHRGVYRVGPLTGALTREMAALLACGPAAALCFWTAAAIWALLRGRPAVVHVAVPGNRRSRDGIQVHREHALDSVTTFQGLRITTAAATIADLAPSLTHRQLARAIEEAQVRRLATRADLLAALPSRRTQALRTALEQPRLTRSEAERRLLGLIARAGLPRPRTNTRIGRHEVDFVWPEKRLIVEVDGFAFHSTREAFERDRARDAELIARGYRVIRFTWRQIVQEPEATIARLAAALVA